MKERMKIKMLNKFENIFSNIAGFAKFECYTPAERRECCGR